MNQETLSNIANQNESLSAVAVLDLVQMCQTFPYFSVPYIILSKHYSAKNDFRTENTLFQAALRTPDRAWLFDYINGKQAIVPTSTQENLPVEILNTIPATSNPSNEIEVESIGNDPTNNHESQGETENTELSSFNNENEVNPIDSEPEIEINQIDSPESSEVTKIEETVNTIPTVEIDSAIGSNHQAIETTDDSEVIPQYEFNKEPELKFDIEEIGIENELETVGSPDQIEFNKEPESMFFVPSIEPETTIETEDIEVEKTNRTWLFDPEIPTETETSTISQPELEVQKVPKLTFSAGYNIEDYFKLEPTEIPTAPQSPNNTNENADFFSWLNSGLANQGPMNKPTESVKSSLIDKFIQENPSIQRPKKEFFSPERAMKKSEVLDIKIATETLANIYTSQGYPEKAVKVYEQLQLKFPEKLSYFASLIEKLKLEHNL